VRKLGTLTKETTDHVSTIPLILYPAESLSMSHPGQYAPRDSGFAMLLNMDKT
jgi:hypothetical protein